MKALILVGPTAAGKTDVSLEIAGDIFEIISADSVQVYRYFDIGSGKSAESERALVTHYMIDVVDPDFPFTAGEFCRRSKEACRNIQGKGKFPLFVGGTGLYIDSFFDGLSEIPVIDPFVRDELYRELENKGLQCLYDELLHADRTFALQIHRNDRQRILRGLEVFRGTGEPMSSYYPAKKGFAGDDTVYTGITDDMESLKKRIDERVDSMIKRGFVEEVTAIRARGYGPELKSMKSIGYHEINEFLDRGSDFGEAVQAIKANTKKYAKRQMTWFRKNRRIRWFSSGQKKEIAEFTRMSFNV